MVRVQVISGKPTAKGQAYDQSFEPARRGFSPVTSRSGPAERAVAGTVRPRWPGNLNQHASQPGGASIRTVKAMASRSTHRRRGRGRSPGGGYATGGAAVHGSAATRRLSRWRVTTATSDDWHKRRWRGCGGMAGMNGMSLRARGSGNGRAGQTVKWAAIAEPTKPTRRLIEC